MAKVAFIIVVGFLILNYLIYSSQERRGVSIHEVPAVELPSLEMQMFIARAAASALMWHDIDIMRAHKSDMGIIVKHNRPSDNTPWTMEFKFTEHRVIWRGVDAFGPGTGVGRWRIHPLDSKIYWKYNENTRTLTLTRKHSDGSQSVDAFVGP